MSNFSRWIDGIIGTRIDIDKAFGYQCVDFVRYATRHLGYELSSYGPAIDIWKKGSVGYEKKIPGSYIPLPGDVIFTAPTKSNKYGHIMLADEGCSMSSYNIVDQNGGIGKATGLGVDAVTRRQKTAQLCIGILARENKFEIKK